MAENTFPFRRMTRAILVPVGTTASTVQIPNGFILPDYNAFMVVNPNMCWVALRGTSRAGDGTMPTQANMAMPDARDWLFNPGHIAVYTTQYPVWMSALAVAMPSYPIPTEFADLRVYYGYGA